jgi:hypothetical protein
LWEDKLVDQREPLLVD